MATQTHSSENKIKDLLNEDAKCRQASLIEGYKDFLGNYKGARGTTSAAVLWMLLGENNHMAVDVIREMRETARYLLGFLAEPETARKFADFRGTNASDFAKHLIQLISGLEWAAEPYSRAETALYELQLGTCSKQELDGLEYDLEEFQKEAA